MATQHTPVGLTVGKALTAQGLVGLVDQIGEERSEAGKAPRMALVDALGSLDFQSGKATFKEAREFAKERSGGDTQTSTHKRLSEAHAIFTALRMAGMKAGELDGLGWQPSVDYARGRLDAAGLTVAGNPRKSDEEKEAERLGRETDAINAAAIEALPPNATPDQIAEALLQARAERAEESAIKTVPDSILRITKALNEVAADFDNVIAARENSRKAWDNLPTDVRKAIEAIYDNAAAVVQFGHDISAMREQAKEPRAAQKQAESELRAQKVVQRQMKAAA